MAVYNVSLSSARKTGTFVQDGQFGANALHDINIDATGSFQPQEGFAAAVDQLDLRHLRYPGGHAENTLDVTRLENGRLRAEVRDFMDWVVANSTPGDRIQVTMVLPTKVDIPAARIEAFVYELLDTYGDYVSGLEIGNEYSIGKRVENADRSTHPEEIPDSDFVSSMNETEYGIAANRVIKAAQAAIDDLAQDKPWLGHDPAILLQLADTNGAGSAYKGNGSWDQANEAILSWLDRDAKAAVDGAVAHYYYNKSHEDGLAFDGGYQEIRSLDQRIESFNDWLGHDVPLYITEWNVLNGNHDQLGMAAASTILEMFEAMVQLDTAEAFIWPLQHRTANTIGGNRSATDLDLSPAGGAFRMLSETLRPESSAETGQLSAFESVATSWAGSGGAVEINQFSSRYEDVLYVSLRDLATGRVNVDLGEFMAEAVAVGVTRMTMDRSSSDGLSDLADDEGLNRIGRRYIDAEELAELEQLAFFDSGNKNHVMVSGANYRTYLPTAAGIVALTPDPRSVDDYYFATEIDVSPRFVDVAGNFLDAGRVSLDMMPYDVAQIVISKKWKQEGTDASERLIGGLGQDVVLGRSGNDTIRTGEGDDTLKGGYGDDYLDGGSGNDSLSAGLGNDTLFGGAGDDTLSTSEGTKILHGGAGHDTLRLTGTSDSYTVTADGTALRLRGGGLDALVEGIETLRFDDRTLAAADLLGAADPKPSGHYGSAADDVLSGGLGCDILVGGGGCDTLVGGDGTDLLIGEGQGLYGTEQSAQVFRLYNAVFGRDPDLAGHQHWVLGLAGGGLTLEEVTRAFVGSREFQASFGTLDDRGFVTLLYENVLDRAPDAAGLAGWLTSLAGGMSRPEVVLRFSESAEHVSLTGAAQQAFDAGRDATQWSDDVYRLYRAIFDRAPDDGGFAGWIDSLASGRSAFGEVISAFMASAEFQATYGATTDVQFVTLLYQNVLKRPPDGGGLGGWLDHLDGGMSREEVVGHFMASPEFASATRAGFAAYMRGQGPDDVLDPGAGDAVLSGGLGADTFVFTSDGAASTLLVTDLEPWDQLAFSGFGVNGAQVLEAMQQQGGDVVLELDAETIVFADTQVAEITAEMISIV